MPGGDQSGPMGQGPRTGRGMGICGGRQAGAFTQGRGLGLGRGFRRRQFWQGPGPMAGQGETLDDLKQQEADLQSQLAAVRQRMGRGPDAS